MLHAWFHELDALLVSCRPFWQCQPFHHRQLLWRQSHPELAASLDALDQDQCQALDADLPALVARLMPFIPQAGRLLELSRLDPLAHRALPPPPELLGAHIPGRKWEQIQHFAAALPALRGPLLEWCAGKGHLGRLLAHDAGLPVTSLELEPALCREGEALARRAGVEMQFVTADAFATTTRAVLQPGQHALALHACGELHTHLMQQASARGAAAISLSPCCYHRIRSQYYQPLSRAGQASLLRLGSPELRLPLQETVTAGLRVRRLRQRELTWRLGFDLLQRAVRGEDHYLPVPNVQKGQLTGTFRDFAHWAAERKGVSLPTGLDYAAFEADGARRLPVVARMELVRHLFRRPLELWLVLDRALYLQEQGYRVQIGEFCAKPLTPRNILIHAERKEYPGA